MTLVDAAYTLELLWHILSGVYLTMQVVPTPLIRPSRAYLFFLVRPVQKQVLHLCKQVSSKGKQVAHSGFAQILLSSIFTRIVSSVDVYVNRYEVDHKMFPPKIGQTTFIIIFVIVPTYAKKVTFLLVSSIAPSSRSRFVDVLVVVVELAAKAVMFLSPCLMYSFSLGRLFQNSSVTCKWSFTTCLGVKASH